MVDYNLRKVLKYFGFLCELSMCFSHQKFDEFLGFAGPIYTYSFFNQYGCFTLLVIVQLNEWYWYVSEQFSTELEELVQTEIVQTSLGKRVWLSSSMLSCLSLSIKQQIKFDGSFFGIKIQNQSD